LNISNCNGIQGQGLIAVAECCKQLRKVDFSANTTLERFAISKIFYECHRLEEVTVNHARQVGDDEIRALAQNSHGVTTFIARESHFISDQALLALSQFCPDLDTVDVSRENGQFRITDVCLLAMGERSKALRVLNLNGCDQVSDVGIQWLANGCRSLEELHMSGCSRVSDAGLRFMGECCRNLKLLDLTGAQYASDVGLTSLCSGCPNLKTLRFKGVWLLADPRLAAPVKGQKLEAWQSVVGIPALVQSCEKLEEIDFSGCFRLNNAVRRYLSTLKQLRTCSLSGCNQMDSKALQALARGCVQLEEVNFNDCGGCVDVDAMKAFAEYCPNLQRVAVNRCPKVHGRAVHWIARIKSLERLEMSNCKGLSDMCILPLTEPDTCPHLSLLSVTKNDLITDTALAWVANGCADQLLTFSFKGTSITKASARAVRDMFAYCDMVFDDKSAGFFPKSRVISRKLLNHYYVMQQGFARIQARVRRWVATRHVAHVRGQARREQSSQIITNSLRIRGAVISVHNKRKAWWKLNRDAEILTSFFWICRAKHKVWRLKQKNYHIWVGSQVECMQRAWRLFWRRTRWRLLKESFLMWVRLCVASATKIASIVRMRQGVTKASRQYQMKQGRKLVEDRKGRFIQRFYRGYKGRMKAYIKKAEIEDRNYQENRGAKVRDVISCHVMSFHIPPIPLSHTPALTPPSRHTPNRRSNTRYERSDSSVC
jgi:F-box/leucine-rich repeat protein 2/20